MREDQTLYSKIVNYKAFRRNLHVVIIKQKKGRHTVLCSTNLEHEPEQIVKRYRERFQIEFVFRDGKQHTGFCDAQVRSGKGQEHHSNLSLLAVTQLRLIDRYWQNKRACRVCSLSSWKRWLYNDLFLRRLISAFELESKVDLSSDACKDLLSVGAIDM